MSLELVKRQTLWSATSLDISAISDYGNGDHFWWNTSNTFTVNANVPPAAWHVIDVSGADFLHVVYSGIVNTVFASSDTVTTSALLAEAVGVLTGQTNTSGQLSAAFPGLGGTLGATNPALDGSKLAIDSGISGVASLPAKGTWGTTPTLGPSGLVHGDGSVVAAADRVGWRLKIGDPGIIAAGASKAGAADSFNVSAYETVYLAVKTFATVAGATGDIDISDYDGEMVALTYENVQKTDKKDRRNPPRRDVPGNIAAGE